MTKKIAIIFLFSFLIFLPLLMHAGFISYVDMTFPIRFSHWSDNVLTTWVNDGNYNNVGNLARAIILLPFSVPFAILKVKQTDILTRFIFFLPFLISMIFSYLLAESVLEKNKKKIDFSILLVVLISNLTPWILNHAWTYYMWVGYAGIMACIYFVERGISTERYVFIFYALPFLFFVSCAPHTVLIFVFICFLFFLCLSVIRPRKIKFYLFFFFLLGIEFLLLNAFWIMPYVSLLRAGGFAPEYIVTPGLIHALSDNNTILNLLTLNGGWNESSIASLIRENPVSLLLFFIPVLLVICAWNLRKKVLAYLIIALVGIFMATAPIIAPKFYDYLAFESPLASSLGWALRSPDRWLLMFNISLPILLSSAGMFIHERWGRIGLISHRLILVGILCGLCPSIFFAYLTIYEPTIFPQEYNGAIDTADSLNNTLTLPGYSLGGYRATWTNKRLGDFVQQNFNNSMTEADFDGRFFSGYLYNLLKNDKSFKYMGKLLALIGVDRIFYDKTTYYSQNTIPDELQYLDRQSDITPLFKSSIAETYKSEEATSIIRVTNNPILDFTGLDTLKYLSYLGDTGAVYFSFDQNGNKNFDNYKEIRLTNNSDLLNLINRKYFVDLSKYVYGGDPNKNNWVSSNYLDDVSFRISQGEINNYEKPNSERFIYTYHEAHLEVPLSSDSNVRYVVLAKYLPNSYGGLMNIQIGDTVTKLFSKSQNNHFIFQVVYDGYLPPKITIDSENGFNVLDNLLVIPKEEYEKFIANEKLDFSSSDMNYFFRTAYDVPNVVNNIDSKTNTLIFKRDSSFFVYPRKEIVKPSVSDSPLDPSDLGISKMNKVIHLKFETKNLSSFDVLKLNLLSEQNISGISVVFNNNIDKEWPFMKSESLILPSTYMFPEGIDRSNVDEIHLWVKCKDSSDCNLSVDSLEFFQLPTELKSSINLIHNGNYTVFLDANNAETGNYVLLIDEKKYSSRYYNGFIVFDVGQLSEGSHEYELHGKSGESVASIYFKENDFEKNTINSNINSLEKNHGQEYDVEFNDYINNVDLVFAKKYNPQWVLVDDNGNFIFPNKAYSLINSYHIATPIKKIRFLFMPVKQLNSGLLISGITIISCLSYLGYDLVRRRKNKSNLISPQPPHRPISSHNSHSLVSPHNSQPHHPTPPRHRIL